MKNAMFIGLALATAAMTANAVDLSVQDAYDPNLHRSGVRVESTVPVPVVSDLTVSFTRLGGEYDRVAAGKSFNLAKLGPVALNLDAAGVYQRSDTLASGFGYTVGGHAEYAVLKNVAVTAGLERFAGERKLRSDNGSILTAGVKVTF